MRLKLTGQMCSGQDPSPVSKQANLNIFKSLFLTAEGWLSVNWTLVLVRLLTFTPAQNNRSVTAGAEREKRGVFWSGIQTPGTTSLVLLRCNVTMFLHLFCYIATCFILFWHIAALLCFYCYIVTCLHSFVTLECYYVFTSFLLYSNMLHCFVTS